MKRLSKGEADRRSPSDDEEEPVVIPAFDNSALIARFRLTLIGRSFHTGGRSTEALLAFMPRSGIAGRWTFALERWEPNIRDDFPSSVTFWITVHSIPLHFWVEDAFRRIGEALGTVTVVDAEEGRVSVVVNVARPLRFKKKVRFDSGDEVTVSLEYERLYRFCLHCRMISQEVMSCPLLTEADRRRLREERLSLHPLDPARSNRNVSEADRCRPPSCRDEDQNRSGRGSSHLGNSSRHLEGRASAPSKDVTSPSRALHSKKDSVWKRIGGDPASNPPRIREQSIQSSSDSRKQRPNDVVMSSREHLRGSQRSGHSRDQAQYRRKSTSAQLQRSPPRTDPSFKQWGSSHPPRHRSSNEPSSSPPPPVRNSVPNDKGKGKAIAEEEDEDANSDAGSGVVHSPPFDEIIPDVEEPFKGPLTPVPETDDGGSFLGNDSVPTDWEDRAEGMEEDTKLTEDDLRLLEECEKAMMLESLMEEDDLLGEDFAAKGRLRKAWSARFLRLRSRKAQVWLLRSLSPRLANG
ncbi:uncharacterized protein LOC112083070 [Eutrema salsugineum]|uniref:uncharacterized protein LOC112083070 n=1 Tax=Eutrema salsugineum TaxID=72664 RepID=UPI000CED47C1|nr:uncharacterized protein LOC112083070 [Eutrema salsugineum]